MALFSLLDSVQHPAIYALVLGLTAYTIYGAFYRLYLSPLAKFPGPKLAALTLWYELYYDLVLGGQYTFKIIELHKKYGPIIRISPWELHISDPDYYDEVYASSASNRKRNKYDWFTLSFGMDLAMFATVDHELHKIRRAALNPFFSTQMVRKLNPVIQERVGVLLQRMNGFRENGQILNLSWMYSAFTNDVVMQYAFARSDHRLEAEDFDPTYRDAAFFGSTAGNFMKHAPWLNKVFQKLPDGLVAAIHPAMAAFVKQKRNTASQITSIITGTNTENFSAAHNTIFHELLDSKLPQAEKSIPRLSDEAQVLMMAGTLTTAWVLEVSTFHLLRQPEILRRLKTEIKAAMDSWLLEADVIGKVNEQGKLAHLETLPYLNAVIKESLRLTYGVAGRLARIATEENLRFTDKTSGKTWVIPAGIPVGMSVAQIHHDESVFPDSRTFNPARWYDEVDVDGVKAVQLHTRLDRYLLSFTRGGRQCMGMPLSYAEMFLCMEGVWNRYGSAPGVKPASEGGSEEERRYEGVRFEGDVGVLSLTETSLRDVVLAADSFLPLVAKGSKGIKVFVLP